MMEAIVRYQGIEYDCIVPVLQLMGIKRKKWPEIFDGIRIMERAALTVINS